MSSTPEHEKRIGFNGDIDAAYSYVESVSDTGDYEDMGSPLWYGWAIREAFLAGISYERNKK